MKNWELLVNNPIAFFYALLTYLLFQTERTVFPELMYIFNTAETNEFVRYFGGRFTYIPKLEEVNLAAFHLFYDYLSCIEKKKDEQLEIDLDLTGRQIRSMRDNVKKWKKFLLSSSYLNPKDLLKFSNKGVKEGEYWKVLINDPRAFLYAVMSYLLSRNEKTLIPEVFYFFNPKKVLKFIELFGGYKIYIPTFNKFNLFVKEIFSEYLRVIELKSEEEIRKVLDLSGYQSFQSRKRLFKWQEFLQDHNYLTLKDLSGFTDKRLRTKKIISRVIALS